MRIYTYIHTDKYESMLGKCPSKIRYNSCVVNIRIVFVVFVNFICSTFDVVNDASASTYMCVCLYSYIASGTVMDKKMVRRSAMTNQHEEGRGECVRKSVSRSVA